MQPTPNAKADRTAEVEPAVRHTVPWRVGSLIVSDAARLRVEFVDGTKGEVEMGAFLVDPAAEGTPFEALRDRAVFAQAAVVLGAVQWPRTGPTWRRTRCTMPFGNTASGLCREVSLSLQSGHRTHE